MREAVTAVFVCGEKVFAIKRQSYLAAFPGYTAFPGGKVDRDENTRPFTESLFKGLEPQLMHALMRELKEELSFNLEKYFKKHRDTVAIFELGAAVTPSFNPYRFKTYFYLIELPETLDFVVDKNEAEYGRWKTAASWIEDFKQNFILAVPPVIKIFKALRGLENFKKRKSQKLELSLDYDSAKEIPMIESLFGVKQFLPLSHTFPPALRTNCFLIDQILIDPSPIDKKELAKLIYSLQKFTILEIFLTHHHRDHHEYSVALAKHYKIPMGMSQDCYERIKLNFGEDYFSTIKIKIYGEGDTFSKTGQHEIKVFSVPGHDAGQLALAPTSFQWFLVGDLIQTIGTVVIGAPEGDMRLYFKSLERVIEYRPKFIIPSHGITVGGINRLTATLAHRKKREQQIIKLLDEGLSVDEILYRLYSEVSSTLHKYARKTILAHIKKIKED